MNYRQQKRLASFSLITQKNNTEYPLYLIAIAINRKFVSKGYMKKMSVFQLCKKGILRETGFQIKENVRLTMRYKIRNNTYYILNCYDNLETMIYQSLEIPDTHEISYYRWVTRMNCYE